VYLYGEALVLIIV